MSSNSEQACHGMWKPQFLIFRCNFVPQSEICGNGHKFVETHFFYFN